jgi:RHS repeat-associated protein
MFDPDGTWLGNAGQYSVFWFEGRYMAAYEGSETYFDHVNSIGSTSMMTDHAGNPIEDVLFTPWGDVLTASGSGGWSFAKMPYDDLKTTTDLTPARVFGPNFGRWMSPDPDNVGADSSDPQTWNMYAYVRNNPTTLTDPTGERYQVCQTDTNGNQTNCADISDAQYNQLAEENKNTLIFAGNGSVLQNGAVIGSYYQYSVDATPGLIAVGTGTQMAAPIVKPLFAATMGFLGVFGPGMLEGSLGLPEALGSIGVGTTDAGPTSDYIDVTRPSSLLPNRLTNVTAQEFGDNLQAEGFTKSVKGDATIYTKGNTQYTVYKAASTGGPSAQVRVSGKPVATIRLQQ